jgi:glycosyltransferase involved in cell wall biosynthesis
VGGWAAETGYDRWRERRPVGSVSTSPQTPDRRWLEGSDHVKVDLVARPPGGRSGVGRYASALCRELLTMGVDARIVPTIGDSLPVALERWSRRHGRDLRSFLASYPLRVTTRREAVTHVTAQTFASMLWLQPGGVVTVHDLFPEERDLARRGGGSFARLFDAAARLGLRRAAAVMTGSEATAAICRSRGLEGSLGVTATSYGVDHGVFRPCAVPGRFGTFLGIADGAPVLLYVGTEAARKRVDVLVHVIARLRRQGFPDLVLVRVGAPVHPGRRRALLALAAALDVSDAVLWLDSVDEHMLAWLYNRAWAYVSAADREGFGLPVLEALACGCAVVVSDIAAHREVVGAAGLVLPPGDIDAWVAGLGSLLRDEPRRHDLGMRAQERAAAYTWRRTAEKALEVYERVGAG